MSKKIQLFEESESTLPKKIILWLKKFRKSKPGLLILDKNFLLYREEHGSFKLSLPEDTAQDLEIINHGKLVETINSFIESNSLAKNKILMILSDTLFFEKTFSSQKDLGAQTSVFLEKVPFENISHRLMVTESRTRILATNTAFFTSVRQVFEDKGFKVDQVLPYLALEKHKLDLNSLFGAKNDRKLKQKLKLLRQHNFIQEGEGNRLIKKSKIITKQKPRVYMFLALFLILTTVLVVMLVSRNIRANDKRSKTLPQDITLTLPSLSSTSAASEEKSPDTAVIKILCNDSNYKAANLFKEKLTQQGFKNILVVSENTQSNTPKTFVVFSMKFPKTLKENIVALIKKTFVDVVVQESNDKEPDVSITVGLSY